MTYQYPYLTDSEFLLAIDKLTYKKQYVRIQVLNFETESARSVIEGVVSAGSLNLSGTSSLRRNGSCTIIVDPQGIQDVNSLTIPNYSNILEVENLVSINKKIFLEIGIVNTLNQYTEYDTIWFPLGMFVIKNASVVKNGTSFNISLTLHDKSAQLNGTCGGVIPAGVIFSEIETISPDGTERAVEYPLIVDIIRSLVVEFGGESASNIIISDVPTAGFKLLKWGGNESVYLNKTPSQKLLTTTATTPNDNITTYKTGSIIGYEATPLVYPGKLECKAGDTVATVLDKIKNTLGNYEWFYDVYGRFHFQKIKNYLNENKVSNIHNVNANNYLGLVDNIGTAYQFNDLSLVSSITVNPSFDNVKNDFTVWGTTKTASGADKPIRYHAILETKPTAYTTLGASIVYKDSRGLWAIATGEDIVTARPTVGSDQHKIYYTLTNGVLSDIYRYDFKRKSFRSYDISNYKYFSKLTAKDWRSSLYFDAVLNKSSAIFADKPYYAELLSEFPKYYDVTTGEYTGSSNNYEYWLDFIESDGTSKPISQFSVESIGRRSKVISDSSVTSLFTITPPAFAYIEADGNVEKERRLAEELGAEVIQVTSEVWKNITVASQRNTAFDMIKDLIQTHTSYNESITLATIPIYYLEPNTLISISQSDMGVNGTYLIKSISLPLTANGTSNIQASRIAQKTM